MCDSIAYAWMGWLNQLRKHRQVFTAAVKTENHTFGMHCPRPLQIKLSLPDFRFVRALGHGYASTVFEAEHTPSKIHCVVKVCMKTRMSQEETKRIRREIRNHSNVFHRHILTFYAAFEDHSAFYLVLEYASQGDLYTYIKRQYAGKVQLYRFIYFILQPLLHAVAYLHSNNIIHRDIKPENILVDRQSIIRLCDFGLSIQCTNEKPRSIVGTLEYMAPEILQLKTDKITDRIDIWAIGVLTYECLVGNSPFAAKSDDEIKEKIKKYDIDFSKVQCATMRDFIKLCLTPDPEKRPSIQDLLHHGALHPEVWNDEEGVPVKRSFSFT